MMNTKQKPPIDITKLRSSLAELFHARRKFSIDKIDDPIDLYFAIVNSLHSYYAHAKLSDIVDTNCFSNCFAHNHLWLDLLKVEKCHCGAKSERCYSFRKFIFDIPMDAIIKMAKKTNVIEMSKSIKLKSGKISNELMKNKGNF